MTATSSYRYLLWKAWTAYAHRAGVYQSWVFLNVVYFVVFGPGALAARLFGARLLDLDARPRSSYWSDRKPTSPTLQEMERQF